MTDDAPLKLEDSAPTATPVAVTMGTTAGEVGGIGTSLTNVPPVVPRLTAFDIFTRALKRAQNLINFHDDPLKDEKEEHADAFRAAIVLSISALDAFVRSMVIEKIRSILANPSDPQRKFSKSLQKYLMDLLGFERTFEAARRNNLHEIVERHVRDDFERTSFQGAEKIEHYMGLAGYPKIFNKVSRKANISEENLRSGLAGFTRRRHIIAHAGDYDLNQSAPTENSITKEYAQNCVDTVRDFATNINELCK